jgi:hypothetical protein
MNKLTHTDPPLTLGCWLARSLAWAATCVLPCAGLGYWVMVVQDADCRTCGTTALLTPLTVVSLLVSRLFYTFFGRKAAVTGLKLWPWAGP